MSSMATPVVVNLGNFSSSNCSSSSSPIVDSKIVTSGTSNRFTNKTVNYYDLPSIHYNINQHIETFSPLLVGFEDFHFSQCKLYNVSQSNTLQVFIYRMNHIKTLCFYAILHEPMDFSFHRNFCHK